MRGLLKNIYYNTLHLKKKIRNYISPTARILLYHRVEDVQNDPHKLCVGKDNFYNQIKFLKENFNIIPLAKLAQDIRNGQVENNTMAITFDDGYADNLYNALPILQEYNVPATIFLTAGYIGQNKPFYWDGPEGADLNEKATSGPGRPMTLDEAKWLSNSRLVEIGGHTIGHPKLAKLTESEQFKEIQGGKAMLEEMLNIPLLSFAYPFGSKNSFTPETVSMAKKAGYRCACANIHERVTAKSDIYALPRFVVRNWSLEEFKKQIKKM